MEKVGMFQLISWGLKVREAINKAYADDNMLTAKEVLTMYKTLSQEIKLPVSAKVQASIDLVSEIIDELALIADDNKVSVTELVRLAEKICVTLGLDLDKAGFELAVIGKPDEVIEVVDIESNK